MRMLSILRKHWPELLFIVCMVLLFATSIFIYQNYKYSLQALLLNTDRRQAILAATGTMLADFLTLTLSIIVEALPFVILGVLISILIQRYVPAGKLLARLPRNIVARRGVISCLGVVMPVCECGNVPVARSLIAKGLSTPEAVIFLLAAPSVNFITFITTWEAFNFDRSVAVIRVVATLIIANLTAIILSKTVATSKMIDARFAAACEADSHTTRSFTHTTSLFRSELWLILRLLVIGALIAAASQTFIPKDTITAIGSNLVLSVIAMLVLAFVISICSNIDAFFALAYTGAFGLGPILAFLVAGPMVDIKMLALMKSTFTYRTLAVITASILMGAFLLGIGLQYVK